MYPIRTVRTTPHDPNDDLPVSHDACGSEIYHGERTILYEGRELVRENFIDAMIDLVRSHPYTLAESLDLTIMRYQ